jgi:integrase
LTFLRLRYGPAMTPDYRPSLIRSFERHLRAENRSEHTIASYLESLRQAEAFLAGRGRSLVEARREDLEAFLGELLQRRAPETVATRYRRLRVLYRWLEAEEEIATNPMAKMRPPIVPEQPVPVVPEDGLRRLLAACAGKDFEARRDTAIVMFLLDTGARRGELADLQLAYAFLVVAAVTEHAEHPAPPGMIELSCNEIQHLFAVLVIAPVADRGHRLRWSWWRRRQQARARACHYRRQAAQQP